MKKRWITILLAACTMAVLAGCGQENQDGTNDTSGTNTQSDTGEENSGQEEETEQTSQAETTEDGKVLVAYFSATGNTKPIAEYAAELTGGDLFEIVPAEPYSEEDLDYNEDDCRANQEQNGEDARPEISGSVANMEEYEVVLIGHPIWWGIEPRIIDTFMESYDFSGKTVANFCTSGGSGIGASTENLKEMAPGANWLGGNRFKTGASLEDVKEWLEEIEILK